LRKRPYNDDGSPGPVKLRACDLQPAQRRIFDVAVERYCMELAKHSPYPSPTDEDVFASRSWFSALSDLVKNSNYADGDATPTQGELELIKARIHNFRGDVRDCARDNLINCYGFRSGNDLATLNHNRELLATLTLNNSFVYR
ncbi:hypothetical protein DXG01_016371, partial [Tephrocybe rancida]